ncbi:putative multidrug resistance protein EmrY [Marinomonas spartinae]|uniref:Putative multidrug resistance protein EmrY n=1 Tax=Marinomonas spartinae TaxID=1792290 RepID=A0A1A8TR15_9GAMM|nr:MFS transporter [Marinomonas spartinae]SBS35319.1 putative multidrug resistance protein EmrY [Marinomonas spartinae]
MIQRISQHKYVPAPSHNFLMLATIFLLMLLNFLQTGMIAFAAAPLMGELGVSPQEYSLTTAAYACVAVVTISKQRWLIERMGWKYYILASLFIFFIGCLICFYGNNFTVFLIGHVVMGFGGAAFMAGARVIVTLFPPSPLRLTGIKTYAYGLTISSALAPFLVARLFLDASWQYLFAILMVFTVLAAITSAFCLPGIPTKKELRSQSHPYLVMALTAGSFLVLYALRYGSYEFYSNSILVSVILLLGLTSIYYFIRSTIRHHHARPLLSIKQLFESKIYRSGVLVFFTCYLIMGSNNYLLPQILQKGLGFSWSTVGSWYALGLVSAILGVWIHMKVFPKRPNGKKFFMFGFVCLGCYGYIMSHLTPSSNMQTQILPAIAFFGFFTVFIQGTAAAKSFKELEHDETAFSHAQQLKNMISQIGMSMGTALASIGLQWRTTIHYNALNEHVAANNPIYQSALHQIANAYGQVNQLVANKMAFAWIAQHVKQNAVLLAGIDYYSLLFIVAIIGFIIMTFQSRLN